MNEYFAIVCHRRHSTEPLSIYTHTHVVRIAFRQLPSQLQPIYDVCPNPSISLELRERNGEIETADRDDAEYPTHTGVYAFIPIQYFGN